ncbi:unnamed protein product [Owenia fusiformis]|uniref:Splicing factor 3A subunit 1 n=1 Tax=Owenia fusiformis TaxID=6347 RepID=A0A8J1XUL5_OWEFU|nr:unnamed protein product [Owenia fusiformis]
MAPVVTVDMDPPQEEEEQSSAPIKPVIGIIYPPPEVRNIVDKTASFVARNGPEFESRIRSNEINNPKFNFLQQNDPYHAYYQHKVKDFAEGKGQEPAAPKPGSMMMNLKSQQQELIELIIPKEPPPEMEFVADPPSISAFDLDVVKLTAQFVARNGRQFLTNLMNREQRNYQFDFLRPQHSLFNYFTKLVEQYTKVLIPPKDLLNKLRKDAEASKPVLEQVKYRVEWAKFQERERQKEEEAVERERVAYAQVDWHDFVVVETVDFQQNEVGNLPPPTTPEEVGARLLAQERVGQRGDDDAAMEIESDEEGSTSEEESDEEEEDAEPEKPPRPDINTQIEDMDEDSDEEQPQQRPPPMKPPLPPSRPPLPPSDKPQPPPLPPMPGQVVVKNYNPKAPKLLPDNPLSDQFLISPITGEKIPADKLQQHMKIGLLDPKWMEQKDREIAEKREQEEVFAPGSSIESSLKNLAERRTDIFGSEETMIGKKIGEEEGPVKEKVTWDGHSASMEKISQKARENISIQEQIAVIHKVKGFIPDEEKEKIGPAMPKTTQQQAPSSLRTIVQQTPKEPPKPQPPKPAPPKAAPPISKPLPPPPVARPPMPPNMAPPPMHMPPQPPGGMVVMQPRPVPPPRPPQLLAMRPPMPPMMQPHMGGPPGYMPRPPPPRPMDQQRPPPMRDEPPSKKAKTEDNLIPENQFLAQNNGPVQFNVQVPDQSDKPEWNLKGQSLTFTLPLTDNVSVIKAKINESLGMPAGKQKLQYEGMFIKDSNTLAFYNFTKGTTVVLQLKERGGRKK